MKARQQPAVVEGSWPQGGAVRHVPCPTCRGPAPIQGSNRWRPFCSERCRQVDLGAWASEQFRVAGDAAGGPAAGSAAGDTACSGPAAR